MTTKPELVDWMNLIFSNIYSHHVLLTLGLSLLIQITMGLIDLEHFMDNQSNCIHCANLLKLDEKRVLFLFRYLIAAHLNHFMEYYSKQNNNLVRAITVVGT